MPRSLLNPETNIVLASQSPQRLELLSQIVPRERIRVLPPEDEAEAGFSGLMEEAAILRRLAEIARHHVGLIRPRGLLLLGNAASRAVLGTELTSARGHLHAVDHKNGKSQAVASFHPRFLIEKPMAKAESWKDLQLLLGDLAE